MTFTNSWSISGSMPGTPSDKRKGMFPSRRRTRPSPRRTAPAGRWTSPSSRSIWRFSSRLEALDRKLLSADWKERYAAEMRRMELVRKHSTPLNMGVAFDQVAPETRTDFYERKQANETLDAQERRILKNRRILCDVMAHAGFTNYPEEIWHFDRGNQFDGVQTGAIARYGAASLSKDNEVWEEMRVGHYLGSLLLHESPLVGKARPCADVLEVAAIAARRAGGLRETLHEKAHCLEAARLQAN